MTRDRKSPGVEPDTELPEWRATAADLRAVFVRAPDPEIADRHLAAMASAIRAPIISLTNRRHRVAVAGVVVAAGVLLTGGMAVAGVLPAPVQNGAARLLHPVGIDIPRSDDVTDDGVSRDQDPVTTTTAGQGVNGPGGSGGQDGAAGDVRERPGPSPTPVDPGGGSAGPVPTATTAPPGQSGSSTSRSSTAPGQTGLRGDNQPAVPQGQVGNPGRGGGKANGEAVTVTSTTVPG